MRSNIRMCLYMAYVRKLMNIVLIVYTKLMAMGIDAKQRRSCKSVIIVKLIVV